MADTLRVDVNRDSLHSVEAPDRFETRGSFTLRIENHGEPTHVHLHLDDDLSQVAHLSAANHYVESDHRLVEVRVDGDGPRPASGELAVVTGYGAERAAVEVSVLEPAPDSADVTVASTGGDSPARTDRAVSPGSAGDLDLSDDVARHLPLIGLSAFALVLAGVALSAVSDPVTVVLGAVAVAAGVAAAAYLLRAQS